MPSTKQLHSKHQEPPIAHIYFRNPSSGETPPRLSVQPDKKASLGEPYSQRAHDLTILYMQAHTNQWNGRLDNLVTMYKKYYAKILKKL